MPRQQPPSNMHPTLLAAIRQLCRTCADTLVLQARNTTPRALRLSIYRAMSELRAANDPIGDLFRRNYVVTENLTLGQVTIMPRHKRALPFQIVSAPPEIREVFLNSEKRTAEIEAAKKDFRAALADGSLWDDIEPEPEPEQFTNPQKD